MGYIYDTLSPFVLASTDESVCERIQELLLLEQAAAVNSTWNMPGTVRGLYITPNS